jgi:hypothetical protein
MFYVKRKLTDKVTVITELHDDNVFTKCPECGKEISIDLAELFCDGEGDLYGTSVYCAGCTKKREKKKSGFDMPITFDGLSWLTGVLRNAGYGESIKELYDKFGIISLRDLPQNQYKAFGNALADIACGNMEG